MNTSPSNRLRLRDIMLKRYLRLGEGHTLTEVMGFLTDSRFEKDGLPYLVVIAEDGSFAGMLSPKSIFQSISADCPPEMPEEVFFRKAAGKLGRTVGDVMDRQIPTLPPDAFLEEAFLCVREKGADVIAVLDGPRVAGLVTARILFEKASTLTVGALSGGVIPDGGRDSIS